MIFEVRHTSGKKVVFRIPTKKIGLEFYVTASFFHMLHKAAMENGDQEAQASAMMSLIMLVDEAFQAQGHDEGRIEAFGEGQFGANLLNMRTDQFVKWLSAEIKTTH